VFPSVLADKTEKACRVLSVFFHPRPLSGNSVSSLKKPKKPVADQLRQALSGNVQLHSAGDLSAAQAASANVNMLGRSVYDGLDALHVRLPSTVGASMRVADLNAESHILFTELALCHS
jgi:hypothetical protein